MEKGSITVDGISLTVAALHEDGFDVAVIPHTLAVTNLGAKEPGGQVNLEVDVLAKYVERLLVTERPRNGSRGPDLPAPSAGPERRHTMTFDHIENAIAAIGRGEVVIVVDDEDRENEGDLIVAAEKITPETMGFMVRHTSGVICMPMLGERLDELQLPLMVSNNTESQRTAFTVSVDAKRETTTGISAADRATTVRTLVDPASGSDDFVRPGPHLPAALPGRRRAQARRPHRGRGGPRPAVGPRAGRGARRGGQRRRHDGPAPAARGVRRRARACS